MATLSCGERIVRCLTGGDIDRVPYGVGLGWSPWDETLECWRSETGDSNLDLNSYYGFDRSFASPDVYYGIYPLYNPMVIEETPDFIIHRDIYGITKRDRRDAGSMPEFLEYPVVTDDDWDRLKAERLQLDTPGRLAVNWDQFAARLRETGEAVQVGAFPFGVFGTPRDFLGVEELLVSFYTRPALVQDMMQHLTSLWIKIWENVARHVQIDHIHIWEDMSGKAGSLISPRMVREFMMPCYDRIAEFARSAGVRVVSVDTDGDCRQLIPIMMAHGVNMMFPFEVQAGNDVRDIRQQYPSLGIMGGLDKRALALSKKDVDIEVDKAEEVVRHGLYVPGFDHLVPPDATWENFHYAALRLREVCFRSARSK